MDRIEKAIGEDKILSRKFRDFLKRVPSFEAGELYEKVDESDYSLRDWAEAIVDFDQWLAEKGTAARPTHAMLGYIHCCTMMNAPQISLPPLNIIVNQSLNDYGFEEISKNHN